MIDLASRPINSYCDACLTFGRAFSEASIPTKRLVTCLHRNILLTMLHTPSIGCCHAKFL